MKFRPSGPGKPQRSAYLFLSPWLLGAGLLTVGPMIASLWLSFTDYDLFDSPKWVGPAQLPHDVHRRRPLLERAVDDGAVRG